MDLWESTVAGAQTITKAVKTSANVLSTAVQWVWNQNLIIRSIAFMARTLFEIIRHFLALEKAIPYLIRNKNARYIIEDMAYVAVHDVALVALVYYTNNYLQNYFLSDNSENQQQVESSMLVFIGLSITNNQAIRYTLQKSSEGLANSLLLDSLAPSIFNANKATPPENLCKNCNSKRFIKGSIREPMILIGDDLLAFSLSFIPYVGKLAEILGIFIIGRYITRIVTPERCERHKAMVQESVLAIGLWYLLTMRLMDKGLSATDEWLHTTLGIVSTINHNTSTFQWVLLQIPPKIMYRILSHFVMLMHINIAAHRQIPLSKAQHKSVFANFLDIYESCVRFFTDVLISGLLIRAPKDLKFQKKGEPLITMSSALAFFTRFFNSDLPSVAPLPVPDAYARAKKTFIRIFVPKNFRTIDNFVNSRLVRRHWAAISDGGIFVVEVLNAIGKTNKVTIGILTIATWSPKQAAKIIKYKWGIPKPITLIALELNSNEKFWKLAEALKGWLERHNVVKDVVLYSSPPVPSRHYLSPNAVSRKEIVPDLTNNIAADGLVPHRQDSKEKELGPEVVLPQTKIPEQPSAIAPDRLFTQRSRYSDLGQPNLLNQEPIVSFHNQHFNF